MDEKSFREHLVRVLDWEDAHVSFDKAIGGVPSDKRGSVPPGFDHSLWQLLEHIRLAQDDIYDFCINPQYVHTMKWPDDYWPQPTPSNDTVWLESIASVVQTRDRMKALAREVPDLSAKVPTGKGNQTYLRAILLVADHTGYHVGQLVSIRRALGIWK